MKCKFCKKTVDSISYDSAKKQATVHCGNCGKKFRIPIESLK